MIHKNQIAFRKALVISKFNLALVPDNPTQATLIQLAEVTSQGLMAHYKLKAEGSMPHISIVQFELAEDFYQLAALWQQAVAIWQGHIQQKTLAITLENVIQYAQSRKAPSHDITWVAIAIAKMANPLLQTLHDQLRVLLTGQGIACKNAHAEHYYPHVTLFNVRTESLTKTNFSTPLPINFENSLKPIPCRLVLGRGNEHWELTSLIYSHANP